MTNLIEPSTASPVPSLSEPDFSKVRLEESGEPLAELTDSPWLKVIPAYYSLGFQHALKRTFVRIGVAAKLEAAAKMLPTGMKFLLWDGLRTLPLQSEIANRLVHSLKSSCLTVGEIENLCARFVSPLPATISDFQKCPPAHATGGAVDISLCDMSGLPLDLGTEFDDFSDRACPDWHERNRYSGGDGPLHLRRLLRQVLISVGAVQYHAEWWHFEFGTVRAAACKGAKVAHYGPVVPADGIATQ